MYKYVNESDITSSSKSNFATEHVDAEIGSVEIAITSTPVCSANPCINSALNFVGVQLLLQYAFYRPVYIFPYCKRLIYI